MEAKKESFAQQRNKEYYNKYGKFYEEYHAYFRNSILIRQWQRNLEIIKNKIPISENIKAIDFGCGTGLLSLMLLELGFFVTAIDISEIMLEELRKKVIKMPEHVSKRIQYINGGIEILRSLRNNSFHLVCESSVLHHLENYFPFLTKSHQLLVDGGVVYIGREPLLVDEQQVHPVNKNLFIKDFIAILIHLIDKYYDRKASSGKYKEVFDESIQPAYRKGGISCKALIDEGNKMGMDVIFKRIYNWRRTKQAFYIDNRLPKILQKGGFWRTFFDIALQKRVEL